MDEIAKILTEKEKAFIKEHNLSQSDFYDARGESVTLYHDKAKKAGCAFVINSCQYGHRLKTRSGHCIECDPSRITFQKRDSGGGVVYIAINGKYTKVGMVDNKMNSTKVALDKREYTLNSEGGYGGQTGWSQVKSWKLERNAGKVESEAHRILEKFKVEKSYIYSGNSRNAKELFVCSIQDAINAVKKAIELYSK